MLPSLLGSIFILFDGLLCGCGLGLLFAVASADADAAVIDKYAEGESFVVVWAFFFEDFVAGGLIVIPLGEFLEVGLGVAPRFCVENRLHFTEDIVFDEFFGGGVALVEIDSADDGLESVGYDNGVGTVAAVFFAAAHTDKREKAEPFCSLTDRLGADECGTPTGKDTLGAIVVVVKKISGDELEHSVAEEF